jgi:hypothetical protein
MTCGSERTGCPLTYVSQRYRMTDIRSTHDIFFVAKLTIYTCFGTCGTINAVKYHMLCRFYEWRSYDMTLQNNSLYSLLQQGAWLDSLLLSTVSSPRPTASYTADKQPLIDEWHKASEQLTSEWAAPINVLITKLFTLLASDKLDRLGGQKTAYI